MDAFERTPHINWKHIDGPLLVCSNGAAHWLTMVERFMLFVGLTDIAALNKKHRGNS